MFWWKNPAAAWGVPVNLHIYESGSELAHGACTRNKRRYSECIGVIRAGCSNKWTKWALRGLRQINTNHLLFLNEMQRYKASVNKHHLCSGAERHVVIALLVSEVCVLPHLMVVQVTIWTGLWKCNIALVK